MQNITNSQEKM